MERIIGIDKVEMTDLSLQLPRKVNDSILTERLLFSGLPGTDNGTHLCMARIKHHLEIRVIDCLRHINNLAGFVEHKSRFKLPEHQHTVIFSDLRAAPPDGNDPIPSFLTFNALYPCFGITHRIYSDSRRAEVQRELEVLSEELVIFIVLLRLIGGRTRVRPEIRRQSRNL